MADFKPYFKKEELFEGTTFEHVAGDSGGDTKFGLTNEDLHEYKLHNSIDIGSVKDLTEQQAGVILKKLYWDFMKGDYITNQSLCEYIVDGGLNQGRILIAKYVQSILNTTPDGLIGSVTLNMINQCNQPYLFQKLHDKRVERYDSIVKNNPSQSKFYKGWINRVNAIKFIS